MLWCYSSNITAQTREISGSVTDSAGEPLIGVSIVVKGTTIGTTTDLDGRFSLSTSMGSTLQVSYV